MTTRPGYVWDDAASEFVGIGQAAVVAPIAYQASQPSSPATGDIWIDSDDDVPSVDSTLYYRWTKTMSGGETSLSGNDNNSLSLQYTPGYESVFINGVLQGRNLDYTATSGSTIAGLTALASNDIVMVKSIVAYSVGDTYTQSQMTSLLDAKSPVSTTGLVLLNTTTFTAQASISIDNVFSATYDNYRILLDVTNVSVDTVIYMKLRSGTDNSVSYYYAFPGFRSDAVGFNSYDNNVTTGWIMTNADSGTNNLYGFNGDVMKPFLAVPTRLIGQNTSATGTGVPGFQNGGGVHIVSTSFPSLSIIPTAGNMTGTIKVYGYK